MVSIRTGVGYNSIWGIVCMLLGIIMSFLCIYLVFNPTEYTPSAFATIALGFVGFFFLVILVGIYLFRSDSKKRKQAGVSVYWGKALLKSIVLISVPGRRSESRILYYKSEESKN